MEDLDSGAILGNDHLSPSEMAMESSSSEPDCTRDDTNCDSTANASLVHESPSTRIYKLHDAENAFGGRTGAVAIKFLKEPHPPKDKIRALHNEYILSRRRPRQPHVGRDGITVAGDGGNDGRNCCGGAGAEACVAMRAALKYDRHRPSGLHAVYLEWADGVTLREWIASFIEGSDDLVSHQATKSASVSFGNEITDGVNGRPSGPPPLMTLVRLASEIAGALSALHDVAGIAHLSLDLDNVIVSEVPAVGGCDGNCRRSCCRGGDDDDDDEEGPRQLIETSFSVKLIDLGMAVVLNTQQEPVTSATSRAVDLVSLFTVLSELFRLADPHGHRQPTGTDAGSIDAGVERVGGTSSRGGLPPSISTLLSRLTMVLGDIQDATGNSKSSSGPPGYRSARDVHDDLRQMLDCPERFLPNATDPSGDVVRHPLPTSDGRLYGRDEELSRIIEVHARAREGGGMDRPGGPRLRSQSPPEVVLISGASGSGKSSLAGSVRRSLSKGNIRRHLSGMPFFLTGKFDQLRHTEPLSTILAAVCEYSERIGGCDGRNQKNDGEFQCRLGRAVRDAVGTEGCSILMDLVPEIRKILEEHPSCEDGNGPEIRPASPPPSPMQSPPMLTDVQEPQHRVKFILQILVNTLASCVASEGGEPLVFFLDDLQWADEASIDLLRGVLLMDGSSNAKAGPRTAYSSLVFIGCHRDIDVGQEQPPMLGLIHDLEAGQEHAVLTKIRLGGISERAMNNLVADTLCMPRSLTSPLADAVHQKTNGNALFAVQFLASLVEDPSFHEWPADVEQIGDKIRAMDDTSGKFIETKLGMLPKELRVALQMAACLGSHCEEDILCLLTDDDDGTCSCGGLPCRDENEGQGRCVCSHPARCLTHLLGQVIRLDLMTKRGVRYEFAHDQIQHAAYMSIPEDERRALHLRIGKCLWRRSPSSHLEERLMFAAVDQILLGVTLVDNADRIPLAELFLRAGKKALSSSLFSAAAMYLKTGISLLGPGHWDDHYNLSLQLYVAYAESETCNGQFDSIQFVLGDVLAHARCFEDKLRPYFVQVNGLGMMNMLQEAIGVCCHVLEHLGEGIPEPENLAIQIRSEYVSTSNMLEGFTDETLVTMRPMKDYEKIAAMEFLFSMVMYTYLTRPSFCPLVALRMVKLSLLHGVCGNSAYAFAWYGALSCSSFGRFRRGYQFGQIALQLLRRLGSNELIARVYAIVYGSTIHWCEPIGQCLEPLLEGQRIGMMFGDVKYAMVNLHEYSICAFHAGRQLVRLEEELTVFCNMMNKYKLKNLLAVATITRQTVQKLMSASDCSVYPTHENIGQGEMAEKILVGMNAYTVCYLHLNWMFLAYHFEDFTLAAEIADKTRNVSKHDFSMWVCIHAFYDSLTSLALAQKTKEDKWKILAKDGMERIKDWAIDSSHNFQNKAALLEAEFASLEGKNINASTLYDESIDVAGKNGFVHEQALSCERAAIFYFNEGDTSKASEFFDQAHDLYMEWGAMGKAERIRAKSLALVIGDS